MEVNSKTFIMTNLDIELKKMDKMNSPVECQELQLKIIMAKIDTRIAIETRDALISIAESLNGIRYEGIG